MITKEQKKIFRKSVSKQSRLVLIYCTIVVFVTIIASIICAIPYLSSNGLTSSADAILDSKMGVISISASFAGMIFIVLNRRKKLIADDFSPQNKGTKRMGIRIFLACFLFLLAAQAIFLPVDSLVRIIAKWLGYTVISSMDGIEAAERTLAFFLYANFLGPLFEEILFRGIVLNGLKKSGKIFSIITSSLLFGLFHGDISQGIFAFLCGLIFGYITLEYSFKWAVVLHITNNFLISEVLTGLINHLPENSAEIATIMLLGIGVAGSVYILWHNKKSFGEYLKINHSEKHTYSVGWTSGWFLIFIIVQIISTLAIEFTKIS